MTSLSSSTPRRSPPEGGYSRGEATRRRVVDAALAVFADEGFEKASTRRIAAAAGVNPPALQYYFDSKEGLHRACADLIVETLTSRLEPVLAVGHAALASAAPDQALEAFCALGDLVADLSVTAEDTPVWRRFIARAQEEGAGGAYPRIKAALGAPMQAMARSLLALAIGGRADDEAVRVRALLLLGQLSAFHHKRADALQAMGWSDVDAGKAALLKAVTREHTRAAVLAARARA